jgi:ribosomal protein S18 acetylase RimI-like enzyme
MIVRPMQPADTGICARWIAETPLWQRYGVTQTSAQRRFELALKRQATIAVAEVEAPGRGKKQLLGFVWYTLHGAFERSGYIPLICVAPGEYGRGVGKVLMDYAEGQVFQKVGELFLLVSDFNVPAQRFYQRRGYIQIGALPDYILSGVSELIYLKHRQAIRSLNGDNSIEQAI